VNDSEYIKKGRSRYFLLLIPLALIVADQTFSKIGVQYALENTRVVNKYILMAYALLFLRGVAWIFLLKLIRLSYAYPLMSVAYFFILLISFFVFNESLSLWNICGTCIIVFGVVLMSISEIGSGVHVNE
jgi:drug/metabolite transporter (DMT)-like permease